MPPISTPMGKRGASGRAAAKDRVIDNQHQDRTDDRDNHAVKIEPADALGADQAEQKTADERPDDPEHDVEKKAFAGLIDDLAADPPGDQAEDEPTEDSHCMSLRPRSARDFYSSGRFVAKPPRSPQGDRNQAPIASLTHFLVKLVFASPFSFFSRAAVSQEACASF